MRNDGSGIMGFIVIHVDTRTMRGNIDSDIVSGAMGEILSITGIRYDFSCDIIDFITFDTTMRKILFEEGKSRIDRFP